MMKVLLTYLVKCTLSVIRLLFCIHYIRTQGASHCATVCTVRVSLCRHYRVTGRDLLA